ncbi:MAG: disulfide bond formation protein B [Gemmatimonadales bacterium]
MIFKGSGDCTKIDWTFLGGSIANWSFVWFCAVALVLLALVAQRMRRNAG